MATKMKIYEIAKSLNRQSKDLIKILNDNGFPVKSHNSSIEDEAIGFILKNVKPLPATDSKDTKEIKKEQKKEEKQEPKKKVKSEEKSDTNEVETIQEEKKEIMVQSLEQKDEKKIVTEEKKDVKEISSTEKTMEKEMKNEGMKEEKNNSGQKNNRNDYNGNKDSRNQANRDNRNQSNRDNRNGNRDNRNGNRDNRGGNRDNKNSAYQGNRDNRNGNGGNRDNRNSSYQGNKDSRGGNSGNKDNRNGNSGNRDNRGNGGSRGNNNNNRSGGFNNRGSFDRGGAFDKAAMDKTLEKAGRSNDKRNSNGYNNKKKRKDEDEITSKKKDPNRKGAFIMPKPVKVEEEPEDTIKNIIIPETLTIKELADKMKVQPASIVKKLFMQGKMVSINQDITFEEAEEIALEYNCIAELEEQVDLVEELLKEDEEDESKLVKRPPVVCVMGHVDHGKTSLLDAIRKTNVTQKEAGGITQHIGAYTVSSGGEKITFLDTPGHEAFTSMRMRGAKSTDIAILVVAADDGVMPQTVEAISHAKAAGVEIIVAINKIDKESANIERVKQELVEYELIAEDWGGSTVFVPVSARTGEGIDQLLEMIILTAEVCELKANPNRMARGIVIEAQLDKGRGPVATMLVQKGTLHVGDPIAVGKAHGKIRAMIDDKGRRVKEATPSMPVEILGLNEVPEAGEIFLATETEKEARNIAEVYIKQGREKLLQDTKAKLSLDGLFSQIQAGNIKELNLIVKADVQGSVEAVKQSLLKLSNDEVAIRIIHGGVGAVNESDVSLASASNAIIIGFNVRPDSAAKETADREKVDLRLYKVIYNAIEDVEAAMKGMLDPIFEEKVIGHAEVRQTFKSSGVGMIAGSYVLDGKIVRNSKVRITRGEELIHEGELASLKRFKDDVKEVAAGYECGLVFEKFNDIQVEDKVEIYIMEEVPR